ncbi:SDR family NAD(P)-dependent oxidoreductase [Nocardiopsis aegyptia]|uniref:type I polyketide synthase n=1 Tax=Nocardiopsis aegyptia TaxID=220378 RepID=UPI00366F0DD5
MTSDDHRLVAALRSALKENARLREELDHVARPEPIAIVGMGCRLPGGIGSPEELWELVVHGRETVGPLPDDRRWDLAALRGESGDEPRSSMAQGSFLDAVAAFDPGLFNISPREAEAMDPQQRLLLEVAWESLERAGISPLSLRGNDAGVYVGTTGPEYGPRLSQAPADGLAMTGTALSVASGRIAYTLGFTGPAITLDTACSSSLVAVQLAVRALQAGECSLALAGGATVMSSPGPLTEFTHLGGLAADGRCKAFGATADGAGFSEGVGLVTLERLSDARRNGRRVLAVIRGGAINQDGASNGLTAPNGPSQVRVIRKALSEAGLTAEDVDLVEAHGTGTTLGDPIEAQALLTAYGQERPADRPLWLGSLKSNVGHAQAAAGVAGLIKVVESLRHGVLPRTLHADEPTPHVDWEAGAIRLLTQEQPWPRTGRPRRAGISSFGMSGTNAHVIVEQAPGGSEEPRPARTASPRRSLPWILSARDGETLRAQADRLRAHVLDHPDADPVDTGWSLVSTRASLEHRAAVLAEDRSAFTESLRALAEGRPDAATVLGRAGTDRRPVFVFPGQGGQWVGMAVDLMDASPSFAQRLAECEKALAPFVDWSLSDVLRGGAHTVPMERVDVVQPVLWAVMVSLADLWGRHGVRPTAVVGHSQGEIAAACVAGALSLEDAAKVVALRSRALLELSGTGSMAAVAQRPGEVAERIAELGGSVHLAVVNSPTSTVVAGEPEAVRSLVEEYESKGVRARMIAVDYASHTPHVARIRERLSKELAGISPRRPDVPMYSTLTGARLDDVALDADYWYRNLSNPVAFADVTRDLLRDGHDVFVEVGPHPVLAAHVQETAEAHGAPETVVLGTLRRDDGGLRRFTVSLAEAHCHGVDVDWAEVFGESPRTVDLPTYAFRHQHFWRTGGGDGSAVGAEASSADADGGAGPDPARDWAYREDWVPVDAIAGGAAHSGTWLLFGSGTSDPFVTDLVAAFERRGLGTRIVDAPSTVDREGLAGLLVDARKNTDAIAGVVALNALNKTGRGGELTRPTASTAHQSTVLLLQALGDAAVTAPLWCVTRGAVPAGCTVSDPSSALVWGLGRVAAQEHSDRWGGMVDLPPADAPGACETLVSVLTGQRGGVEDQLAIREGAILARRLVRAPISRTRAVRRWEPSGTVLVTGGTGALGSHTARWLARRGAQHLLLLSRRGTEAPGAKALEAELRSIGAEVTIASCDVADRSALAAVLDRVPGKFPLRAVVHAAASLDDGAIDDLTPDQVACALRAKGDAAVHLHELTQGLDLSAFVVYSSVSAVFGVTGQGNYAPGNAFCEALVHHRRALGLPATSISWGAWADGGMAEDTAVAELLRRHGLPTMDPGAAITMLERVLDRDLPALAVADVDWPRFRAAFTVNRPSPLLRDLAPLSTDRGAPDQAVAPGLEPQLRGLGRIGRRRALTEHVRREVAAILGYASADALDEDRGYKDLGMDSVTAIELRNRLSALTGLNLPAGLAFSHPTCAALGRHLEERLFGDTQQIVMTRIDSIEEALAEDEDSAMDREAVARRLQDLLKRLTPSKPRVDAADEDLESASREELFAFIDDALRD